MKHGTLFLALTATVLHAAVAAEEREAGDTKAAPDAPAGVQLPSRDIRLGDVAVVPENGANPVIARLPRGTNRIELTRKAALRMIRNRLPMHRAVLLFDNMITLVPAPDASAPRTGNCFAASAPITKGDFISASLVESTPCKSEDGKSPIGYDREARAPVASQAIAAGTYLGPLAPVTDRRIAKDADVLLVTGSGPVTITRAVTTMQAGREGRSVLIRTSDGNFFTVPVSHLSEDLAQ